MIIKSVCRWMALLLGAALLARRASAQIDFKLPAGLKIPSLPAGFKIPTLPGGLDIPHILEPLDKKLVDDHRFYLKPGISVTELLRARGYRAREHHFVTRDGYHMLIVRATNPLAPAGPNSKKPILFINPAVLSAACYLLNSVGVKPRYHSNLDLSKMSVEEVKEHLADEPAINSLPLLALNLGYECWFMSRRGFSGPRRKHGNEKRTLTDAWKSVPAGLIEHLRDGFSKPAQLEPQRPLRTKTHSRNPLLANQNGTIHIEGGEPVLKQQELGESSRAKREPTLKSHSRNLLLPPQISVPLNILHLMVFLAKVPGAIKRMGDIRHEFIETFDPDFWRFSLDEQIEFDVPQAIDFVLEKTGKKKVHTVGLSCGGAVILLALAKEPSLAKKISRAIMWAPSVNLGSKSDSVYRLSKLIPMLQNYIGPIPFVFLVREIQYWMQKICSLDLTQRTICAAFGDAFAGFSGGQGPLRPNMVATLMTPTSTNEFIHLAQMAHTQRPCKFSFPSERQNIEKYGQVKPPCYNLGDIQLRNISFYVGAYDTLVSPDDIATTELQMRVPSELHIIKGERINFNHFGFLLHKNTDELSIIPSMLDIEQSEAVERLEQLEQQAARPHKTKWWQENLVDSLES